MNVCSLKVSVFHDFILNLAKSFQFMNRRNRISKLNESFTFKKSGRTEPTFLGFVLLFGHCPTFWVLSYLSYFFGIIPTFVLLFGFFSLLFLKFLVFRPSLMLRYLWGTRITIATFSGVYHCPMGRL